MTNHPASLRRPLRSTLAVALGGLLLGVLVPLALPGAAQAHVERPSYWPDPKPDCSITPCAGGKIPAARSLRSALDASQPGRTRVVCKPDSMTRLKASIAKARRDGYRDRPTVLSRLSRDRADMLLRVNRKLFERCEFRHIQAAVTRSRNNDRVVVMPGLYLEGPSRARPTHDPSCDKYEMEDDGGDPGALSHEYQIHCPNDANLIAVIGRGSDTGPLPDEPREDRHGVPNPGKCIRCNLQLEGSGVNADDVVVEAGSAKAGDGGPSAVGHKKDVGVFADRADGFVLRNMKIRHAREHDIYVLETDGYRLERFKVYYAGGYGVLSFVGDHGLMQHCDAAGHGDSGLYPGSGADSTDNRYKKFYPKWRYSQTIRYCDSHHNTGGFSGTNSHGTLIEKNNFYDNALGYTTDVFTAPGHPGFPQFGNTVRDNNFYLNNFNPYLPTSDVDPFIPAPVGTGLWLAGGNLNRIRGNYFYDNYRRGTMLFAVPDATVCGPPPVGSDTPVPGCDETKVSTSFGNKFNGNFFGVDRKGRERPNGLDMWWDAFPGNTGNCFWDNKAAKGKDVTTSPLLLPDCADGTQPETSIGTGDVANESELAACLAGFTVAGYPDGDDTICDWTVTPEKPSGDGPSLPTGRSQLQQAQLASICQLGLSPRLCDTYATLITEAASSILLAAEEAFSPLAAATPTYTEGRLSTFTCTWWRGADDGEKLGMIHRIRDMTTAKINGRPGDEAYGYGAGLSDGRAALVLEDRCSTFQAGPFALYKIYGAAAPFAALAG